jgi:hypothetical protein
VERGAGAGEFLAFVLVVILSACAFFVVSSSRTPSVARVVSMEDARPLDEQTASISDTSPENPQLAAVPIPTPRPE